MLIYVDNLIVTGTNSSLMNMFVKHLNKLFALKDLGNLNYFLGIEVKRNNQGLLLSQTKYIEELLLKTNMHKCKPCSTPATCKKEFSHLDGKLLENPTQYRRLIGALQYITHTRPDISYIVNKLSQFLQAPTENHWQAGKRILRYLKGTKHLGLQLYKSTNLSLQGYSDADWACDSADRKSIGGYCVFFGKSLVSWSSKKQNVVSRSSTESEYRALANVACELTWIESLLKEIQFPLNHKTITWCDNIWASALESNPVFHARTKHIEIDQHFVRDKVLAQELEVRYLPSEEQTVVCLTNVLPAPRFAFLRDKLGVVDQSSTTSPAWEGVLEYVIHCI